MTVQLEACRERIHEISEKGVIVEESDATRLQYFTHTLRVFEVELLALLKDWDGVSSIVGVCSPVLSDVLRLTLQ